MNDKIATREAYGRALVEFGKECDFVVLDADLSGSTKTKTFAQTFPDRFINCGIAEGNMMSTAAGIATTGRTAFASTFAIFAAGRAFEQIRNSICYPKLNVKIGATHAGLSVGEDGATHQSVEDIALMRAIPNMIVLSPADATETKFVIKAAIEHDGPVYIRLGRLEVPQIFDENTYKFELGKGQILNEGNDITIISTGLMTHDAIKAVNTLKNNGIEVRLINMPSIKPIDEEIIIKAAKETGCIITVEEHSVIGGLGSAVADVVCKTASCKVVKIGVNDVFGQSGEPNEILKYYGLTENNIVKTVKDNL